MKRSIWSEIAVATIVVAFAGAWPAPQNPAQPSSGPESQVPLPGYQTPTQSVLLTMRDNSDQTSIRTHSWSLFPSLVSGAIDHGPIWQTWCAMAHDNKGASLICPSAPTSAAPHFAALMRMNVAAPIQALQQNNKRRMLMTLQPPRQFTDAHSPIFSVPFDTINGTHNPALMEMSEVLFDPDTAKEIVRCYGTGKKSTKNGYDQFPLRGDLTEKTPTGCETNGTSFGSLQRGSIAIKTVWAATAYQIQNSQGKPIAYPIPVWDNKLTPSGGILKNPNDWTATMVSIRTDQTTCDNPGDFVGSDSQQPIEVPLGCFYNVPLSASDLSAAPHGQTNIVSLTEGSQGKIYLVLLGFHVATKEIPDWTWQTYWWSARAASDEQNFRQGNPSLGPGGIDVQWSHYVMNSTFGAAAAAAPSSMVPVFNPYLEGGLQVPGGPGGTQSNCLGCHQYAVFHSTKAAQAIGKTPDDLFKMGANLGLVNSLKVVNPCTGSNSDDPYFKSGAATDCLWSLADSNDTSLRPTNQLDFRSAAFKLMTRLKELQAAQANKPQ